ncbi:MAG: WYL domain-containing protein, partial [Bacteroidia bacterium]
DRVLDIKISQNKFSKEHPSLKAYIKQVTKEKELHTVIMNVDKEIVKHLGDQKYYNGFVSQKEFKDHFEMTFLSCSIEGFARWYMMFGDNADIISPESLKTAIKKIAFDISKRIK